eukprot:GHVR01125427.1.p1 GENE.GHVR01125427.1~~GHVR01125427.1.p1  ORF type:complete len:102 (-),score=8.53 GHVR01125427.1:4996-5301(-)
MKETDYLNPSMVMVFRHGQMRGKNTYGKGKFTYKEGNMKGIIAMVKRMDMESIHGLMEDSTEDTREWKNTWRRYVYLSQRPLPTGYMELRQRINELRLIKR